MTPSGKHAIFLLVMVLASTTVEAQREISILPFVPKADVGVTITRSPATVTVGEPLFFTIDVFNNGAQSTDAPFIFNAGNHHMDDGPTYTDIELVSGSGATVQNMYETNTGFRVTFINFIRGG